MVKMFNPPTHADIQGFNVRPSNSSKRPYEPVDGVKFNKDASFYDMSGDKFLIILNQHKFEKTEHFKHKPSTRDGTFHDERRLKEVFYELGFQIFVLRDLEYENIIETLTAIASLDHTRTSCVCVTVLTHGDKGGQIFAADRPYSLSELIAIFEQEPSLTNKPKLFFIQACRGDNMDAGHTVYLDSQSDGVPSCWSAVLRFCCITPQEGMMIEDPQQAGSNNLGCCGLLNLFKGAGNSDHLDSQGVSVLTVPTHADTLVLRSTVEDYLSYRTENGSWMIQALCDTIQENYEELTLLDIIIQVNKTVAYERITHRCRRKVMNNKKQMPEARFTLTKQLKF